MTCCIILDNSLQNTPFGVTLSFTQRVAYSLAYVVHRSFLGKCRIHMDITLIPCLGNTWIIPACQQGVIYIINYCICVYKLFMYFPYTPSRTVDTVAFPITTVTLFDIWVATLLSISENFPPCIYIYVYVYVQDNRYVCR